MSIEKNPFEKPRGSKLNSAEQHPPGNEERSITPKTESDPEAIKPEVPEKPGEKEQKKQADFSSERVKKLAPRYEVDRTPVLIDEANKETIEKIANEGEERLKKNYQPGFGVFPSAEPKENFFEQLWTRDFAQAGINFYIDKNPAAVLDSLKTIFNNQRADGALPLRTEKQYLLLKLTPGLRSLAKPLFNLIDKRIRGREERPVYEGQDFSSAEDTVPLAIMAAGEFALTSPEGGNFAEENFESFKRAIDFFKTTKVDNEDELASLKNKNADWADSINRGGKLGGINVFWARSMRLMGSMATQLGKREEAASYREEFSKIKKSILDKLYDKEGAYFRAEEDVDRIDTTASVFGSLYLLNPEECVRVQESLKKRVKAPSGLKNFDPPYPPAQIMWPHKVIRLDGYHNKYVWPWLTCQNIQVKIKIALGHPEETVRQQYKNEAVEDLVDMAKLFNEANGAYEIFEPDTRKPVKKFFYKPPQNIMANLAAFESAHRKLKDLGWI